MKNFRTYQLAVEFYKECQKMKVPSHLRNQLDRASSSICLNLAEGCGRFKSPDQNRFYRIAFASFRECQAIMDLASNEQQTEQRSQILGAHLYRLLRPGP